MPVGFALERAARTAAGWPSTSRSSLDMFAPHPSQRAPRPAADQRRRRRLESTSSLLAAQPGQTIEVVNQAARLMSAIVVGGVTAVITLVACSGSNEGTVVAKGGPIHDYAYCPTGTVVGPMGIATLGSCSSPTCWRGDIRDSPGNTTALCVRRELYDAAQLGTFWQEPTDR